MNKHKILILEDEILIAYNLQRQLEQAGYQVAGLARTAQEARSLAEQSRPDLALVDIRLPGERDGIDSALELRKRFDLPVIYLTAYSDAETLARAAESAPYGYLLKPVEPHELLINIQVALRKHQAEQEIHARERRYRTILQTTQDGFWIVDTQGHFVDVNQAYCELSGYSREELLGGMTVMDVEAVETPAQKEAHIARVMERGFDQFETRQRAKNGRIFDVAVSVQYLPEEKCFFSFIRDISADKQAQKSLQERNQFIETVMDNLPIGLAVNQVGDGRVVYMNPAFEQIYGWPRTVITDVEAFFEHIYPDPAYRQQVKERVLADINSGDPARMHWYDILVTRQDGSQGIIEAHNIPVPEHGLMISTVMDVSEKTRAQQALSRSQRTLSTLLSNLPGMAYRRVADDVENITFASQGSHALTGYSPEALTATAGDRYHQLVHPDDRAPLSQMLQDALEKGDPYELVYRIQTADGLEKWVWDRGSAVIDAENTLPVLEGFVSDISERKLAEETLKALTNKLQTRMKEIQCLYGSSKLLEDDALSQEARYQQVLQLLQNTFSYPQDAAARLELQGSVYQTPGFQETQWRLAHAVLIDRQPAGELLVCYQQDHPTADDGPFLREEAELLAELAGRIGSHAAREQAGRQLLDSEARYRTTISSAGEAIVTIDDQGQVLSWNQAAERIFGYRAAEILGKSLEMLMPAKHRASHKAGLERVNNGGERRLIGSIVQMDGLHKDGRVIHIELSLSTWVAGGKRYYSGFLRDISERVANQRFRETMLALVAALRDCESIDEINAAVLEQLGQFMHLESAALALPLSPSTGKLLVVNAAGQATDLVGEALPAGENDIQAAAMQATIGPPEIEKLKTFFNPGQLPHAEIVLLRTPRAPVGLLFVARKTAFEEADRWILNGAAEVAANAIRRAEYSAETRRSLERLEALREIDLAITSVTDLRTTAQILVRQAGDKLNADAVRLRVFETHLQTFSVLEELGFHSQAPRSIEHLADDPVREAVLGRHTVTYDLQQLEESGNQAWVDWLAHEGLRSAHITPLITKGEVKGVLEIFHRTDFEPAPEWLDFLNMLARQAAIAIENNALFNNLQRSNLDLKLAYDATLEGWARTLELRDMLTEGHSRRVTEMTLRLARALGMQESELVHVRRGALLHDIGKIAIPDAILQKPGKLTQEEWGIMKQHPQHAYDLLYPIEFLRPALDIPYAHHEKWDGTGYPRGLKGQQIPLAARIFAVVDVWDALTSERPYRRAWSEERARQHIGQQMGIHFDPQVVKAFLNLLDPLEVSL